MLDPRGDIDLLLIINFPRHVLEKVYDKSRGGPNAHHKLILCINFPVGTYWKSLCQAMAGKLIINFLIISIYAKSLCPGHRMSNRLIVIMNNAFRGCR